MENTPFINEEPITESAPIAIGTPVNPIIAVSAIDDNGAVATTVITPPNIIPINIGLEWEADSRIPPIFNRVEFTIGLDADAINLANGEIKQITKLNLILEELFALLLE